MILIILVAALIIALIYLGVRDKKQNNELIPNGEFTDLAHLSYEEKIQKYKADYYEFSPTLRTRF